MKEQLGGKLEYHSEKDAYITTDGKFMVVECARSRINPCIDMLSIEQFSGHKVICVNSNISSEEQVYALNRGIEIVDKSTIAEIASNIANMIKGKNIPAIGHGTLKMQVITEIKSGMTM